MTANGKEKLKWRVSQIFRQSGLTTVQRVFYEKRGHQLVPILLYHSIDPDEAFSAVHPDRFREQMAFLFAHYSVIPLARLVRALRGGESLPPRAVVLTFDDGYADNYYWARPVLEDLGFPYTIFVAVGFIGKWNSFDAGHNRPRRVMLSWDQLAEMAAGGAEIGAHTMTHRVLASLSLDEAREEIKRGGELLQKRLGVPVTSFAYPKGQMNHFNFVHMKMVEQCGYEAACSTIWGSHHHRNNLFALPRIRIDGQDDLDVFKLKLECAYDWIRWVHRLRWL